MTSIKTKSSASTASSALASACIRPVKNAFSAATMGSSDMARGLGFEVYRVSHRTGGSRQLGFAAHDVRPPRLAHAFHARTGLMLVGLDARIEVQHAHPPIHSP